MKRVKQKYLIMAYLSRFMMIIGLILFIPLLVLPFYPQEVIYCKDFIIPALIAILLGGGLTKVLPFERSQRLSVGDDAVIVVGAWILAIVFSAMPFVFSHQLNVTQAIFESVSGWTTTGLSVVNTEQTAHIFLIHRSVTQFFGGVGIVLVLLSALSSTFGLQLYQSEGHNDYLLPNLIKSSRLILGIYFGYIIIGVLLYTLFGMPLFDAINHSIGALSTGGFSVKTLSIEAYDSVAIEVITIVLMLLGTTNFAAHLLLLRGRLKSFFKLGEIKFMALLIGIGVALLTVSLAGTVLGSLGDSFRVAIFQVISALSTTGYATTSYTTFTSSALFIMIVLMIIGGGAGSTSGGIKLYRFLLLVKQSIWNVYLQFKPEHLIKEPFVLKPEGKVYLTNDDFKEASNYAFIYMVLLGIGTFIFLVMGYPLQESLFEFASSLGTVGLSIGITAPDLHPLLLWTEIVGMLFGRLEIWVIFISLIKICTRRKRGRN